MAANRQVKLVIWDIAGQPSFRQVRRHYYSGAHGALLVYDVTIPSSFMTLHNWDKDFMQAVPDGTVILVANKVDLAENRIAPKEAGLMLKKWWQIPYVETSAATAEGVQEAFVSVASHALEKAVSHGANFSD